MAAELRSRATEWSDQQMLVGISRLIALANDSHTAPSLFGSGLLRRYPLTLRWFSDGLFVVAAPEEQAALVGKRVLRIGKQNVERAYQSLKPFVSHDTESWFREISPLYLTSPDFLLAAGILDEPGPLELAVEMLGGEELVLAVPTSASTLAEGPHPAAPSWPLYRQYAAQDYWFRLMKESATLYIKYNRCRQNVLLPIGDFAEAIIRAAVDAPPLQVIFDLRDNTGGSDRWLKELLDRLGRAYQDGRVPFPERGVFAIMSKRTFSSGTLGITDLKRLGATLVGETTGGNPSWYGDTTTFQLAHSRLVVAVSKKKIEIPGFPAPIEPDIAVDFNGADYFAQRDPYLAAILQR